MQIYRAKDYEDMSKKAANIIASQVVLKPDCVLGLATGSTPIGAYKNLVEKYEQGDLDFSQVTTVNLDIKDFQERMIRAITILCTTIFLTMSM